MRALTLAKNAVGCVAVAAMLVLSFPGVEVVRAGEPHAEEAVCSEGPRVADSSLRALDREIALELQRPRPLPQRVGAEEIVVLNGRGYNYANPPSPAQTPPPPALD